MPLALILPREDQRYLLRKPLIRRNKGDKLSLLVQFLLKPWVPYAPPPCFLVTLSLTHLGWQLLTIDQPFLFYIFSSFHPSLPSFPHGIYNYFAVSCASSPLFRPLRSYPRSRSRYPRPRSHLRFRICPRFLPRPRLCVLSFHLFWTLDLWTYQPGSHRRKVTQDLSTFLLQCFYCLNFSREEDSAVSFPRRP